MSRGLRLHTLYHNHLCDPVHTVTIDVESSRGPLWRYPILIWCYSLSICPRSRRSTAYTNTRGCCSYSSGSDNTRTHRGCPQHRRCISLRKIYSRYTLYASIITSWTRLIETHGILHKDGARRSHSPPCAATRRTRPNRPPSGYLWVQLWLRRSIHPVEAILL